MDTISTYLDVYSVPGTYQWSPASGLSDPNVATPVATVSGNQTYQLSFTDSLYGCLHQDRFILQNIIYNYQQMPYMLNIVKGIILFK